MPTVGARLPKSSRLRAKGAFRGLIRRGIRIDGGLFVLFALPNGRKNSRIGLSASRKIGGAVQRNRAKRLLREAFRKRRPEEPADVLLVAKQRIVEESLNEVEREYRERLRRLRKRWSTVGIVPNPTSRN